MIECATHGQSQPAFVCHHLADCEGVALGFNSNPATESDPTPDAWCDNCEIIRAAHDGWTEESASLTKIKAVCAQCYKRIRIRNTRTDVSFADLAGIRWKCGTCEKWHEGACLDIGFGCPYYWREELENDTRLTKTGRPASFLKDDMCAVDDEFFFLRGIIHLPIIGSDETFRWGVWGSLSRSNFETLLQLYDDAARTKLPPLFSWLSNNISGYPETLNLKMYAHIQEPGERPYFELESADHPLALEFHNGIAPERVRELMRSSFASNGFSE